MWNGSWLWTPVITAYDSFDYNCVYQWDDVIDVAVYIVSIDRLNIRIAQWIAYKDA